MSENFNRTTSSDEKALEVNRTESPQDQILYGLTNDYMFKAVFQKNEKALRGLLCAILNLEPEEITSCEVTNPIILGESIDEKTCILDLRISLNDTKVINLEMQVGNLLNWPKRSVYYLCTMYTDVKRGEDYYTAKQCTHIGFVTKSPFNGREKFISRYQLMDPEDSHIYSDELKLIMVDLSQIHKITPDNLENKDRSVLEWAKLFCAHSWKEASELASGSEAMQETINTMKELSEDQKIRERCLARSLYNGDMKSAKQEGIDIGIDLGKDLGKEQLNKLNVLLLADNRLEDLKRSLTDKEFQETLLCEYHI